MLSLPESCETYKTLQFWASRDAGIPSLGAFCGNHFVAFSEAFGILIDISLFTCQRHSLIHSCISNLSLTHRHYLNSLTHTDKTYHNRPIH